MMELVYSIDDSAYLLWQADFLDWSVRQVGMDCRITRLTALAPDRKTYACLNRFHALVNEWKEGDAETVVVLDPDMVFVRPLQMRAPAKALLGQPYGYLHNLPWCPLVIHRDHVRQWATLSLQLARALHANGTGWISEMWASSIAAGIIGLSLDRTPLSVCNCDVSLGEAYVIHYCYDHGGFSKQRYKPDNPIPIPSSPSEVTRRLIQLLSMRFAAPKLPS